MTRGARSLAASLATGLLTACVAGAGSQGGTPASGGPAGSTDQVATASPGVDTSPAPGASLPVLPAAMPVHPVAVVADLPPAPSAIAAWTAAADPPNVYDFYLESLPAAGFVVDGAYPGGDAAIIRFSAADGTAYQLDLTGHEPVHITFGAPHD